MGCHRNTKRCDFDFRKDAEMPKCCYDHLLETIFYISDLFKKHDILHWIDFGTLLGATRNHKIIKWDSDGDFGLLYKDVYKVLSLKEEIKRDGFYLYYWNLDFMQIGYSETNWNYCDLYFNKIINANQYKPSPWGGIPKLFEPIDFSPIKSDMKILTTYGPVAQIDHKCDFPFWFVNKPTTVKLEGKELPCPKYPRYFCKVRYGPNWKNPVRKKRSYSGGNGIQLRNVIKFVNNHR